MQRNHEGVFQLQARIVISYIEHTDNPLGWKQWAQQNLSLNWTCFQIFLSTHVNPVDPAKYKKDSLPKSNLRMRQYLKLSV
jgi:hypothetical protein